MYTYDVSHSNQNPSRGHIERHRDISPHIFPASLTTHPARHGASEGFFSSCLVGQTMDCSVFFFSHCIQVFAAALHLNSPTSARRLLVPPPALSASLMAHYPAPDFLPLLYFTWGLRAARGFLKPLKSRRLVWRARGQVLASVSI